MTDSMHGSQPEHVTCWSERLTIKLIHDRESRTYTASDLDQLADERPTPFNTFAQVTTRFLIDLLASRRSCDTGTKGADASTPISLTFLYCTLSKDRSECNQPSDGSTPEVTLLAETPWARIGYSAPDSTQMIGTFKWDIRQFLTDRLAVETGLAVAPPDTLSAERFKAHLQDYIESILLANSAEARDKQLKEIKKRIPADILWLFSNAWQTTRGPFENEIANAVNAFEEDILEYAVTLTRYILVKALDERTGTLNITTAAQVPEDIQNLLHDINLRD